ncbi:MAG TPA: permease prefix domain 1-containing protein, partial [Archangium sp.]
MLALRARLRLLFRREAEERMEEEMRFHLEMETEKNLRAGMSPAEARRQARLAFGGVEGHKERMRDGRTFAWAGGMSLDLKLGLRMLRKHPALALVGGLGMAVAVAIGAGAYGWIATAMSDSLPLDEGDRIVSIQNATDVLGAPNRRSLHDFLMWHDELKSVDDLGAFRDTDRNLITGDGPPEPVKVAEITASGFGVARVPPRMGRYL